MYEVQWMKSIPSCAGQTISNESGITLGLHKAKGHLHVGRSSLLSSVTGSSAHPLLGILPCVGIHSTDYYSMSE